MKTFEFKALISANSHLILLSLSEMITASHCDATITFLDEDVIAVSLTGTMFQVRELRASISVALSHSSILFFNIFKKRIQFFTDFSCKEVL